MVKVGEESPIQPQKVQYPHGPSAYRLGEEIGVGVSATVYKAECIPLSLTVAIKAINLDRSKADLDSVRLEAKAMSLLSHPNILEAHCSFTVGQELWVVMPFMSGGSLQSIISSSFPDGLPEVCIAVVLKETLNALSYLHDQGHLHRDIKAGNILIGANGCVKLADFGVSASIYESILTRGSSGSFSSSSSSMRLTDLAGTPYWMAPEVIHSHVGYSYKADIWSFGITALELARGRPPLSHLPPSESILAKITKKFRFSDYEKSDPSRQYRFSKLFKDMVRLCLDHDPAKRPSSEKLLKHSFFRNCKGTELIVRNLLQGLPSVEERFKFSKLNRLGSMSKSSTETKDDVEGGVFDENLSKQRRISGWNFNEDGLELVPVFPSESPVDDDSSDTKVKQVRFGGETIIQDHQLDLPPSEAVVVEPETSVPAPNSTSSGTICENLLVPPLRWLQQSLEVQKEILISMIQQLGGHVEEELELTTEDRLERDVNRSIATIEKLKKELDFEKQRTLELEKQLEERRVGPDGSATPGSGE